MRKRRAGVMAGISVMFAEDPESGAKLVLDVSSASSCRDLLSKGDILEAVRLAPALQGALPELNSGSE